MNFGIIGLGNIANKFARTLNEMNECLYAVASRNLVKAKEFATKYNSLNYYGSYEELFNDSNVDVIYIATPNNMHFQNAYDALLHGKHVICEKPFTTNHDDAIKLYNYAKEHNLFIMEALWIEFLPGYNKLIEVINSGEIGDIKYINVSYGYDTTDERKIRKFDSSLGGGAWLDIGIYNLGFVDMIMNEEVKYFDSAYFLNDYGTDEYSFVVLSYENNIHANLVTTIGEDLGKVAYIHGTKGKIVIPDYQHLQEFTVKSDKEITYKFPFEINGFEYQIKEAINCINNKKWESDIYPAERSIRLMKLLYDIRMSWNMKFSFEK